MKSRKVHIVVLLTVLAAVATVVVFATQTGRSQFRQTGIRPTGISQSQQTRSNQSQTLPNKPTVKSTVRVTAAPSIFAAAAERNALLKNELTWTFGGKQQRGWYLYD